MTEEVEDPHRAQSQDAETFYRTRAERFSASVARAREASARLSNLRILVFFGVLGVVVVLGYLGFYLWTACTLLLGIAAFTVLVVRHHRIENAMVTDGYLLAINAAGLQRMQGQWKDAADRGEEFADSKHAYADDLDLFGRASLFQWICAAETRFGRATLAESLKAPKWDHAAILERQALVRELAPLVEWRQAFQAAGKEVAKAHEDPDGLIGWAEANEAKQGSLILTSSGIAALRFWGLVVPVCVITFGYFIPIAALAVLPLLINGWLLARFKGRVQPVVAALCRQRKNLEAYQSMLGLIEKAGFTGSHLSDLAKSLGNTKVTASQQAKKLITIAQWLDIRENPMVHFVLNYLLLWDLQWLVPFQAWKRESGKELRKWLQTIAQVEAWASLAIIRFENPQWCFPEVAAAGDDGEPRDAAEAWGAPFKAQELGHPLIASQHRVCNVFHLGAGQSVILTGSNMTGKSTWLRTVGINLVLAYAGAPVCATALRTRLFHIHTSMRLKDDLDQGVSSFYAELLRLRRIMDAARQGLPVLFLIDEIFRGTNSVDRIAGAREVLLQLARLRAIGLVSTHDLELGQLAESHGEMFRNSHFSEHFEDGKIRFDFKLQPGISTTRNAIHLMHLAGVTGFLNEKDATEATEMPLG